MHQAEHDDASYFAAVDVTTSAVFVASDGQVAQGQAPTIRIDASTLPTLVAEALGSYPAALRGGPVCVISGLGSREETFTKKEHFLPDGLGFPWASLLAGAGTCDRVNGDFSRYEAEWLRQGLMGCFRPFFVAQGKDDPPAYYAPKMSDKHFWFTRGPDGRRTFNFSPDVRVRVREGPPRMIRFDVPRSDARPEWVSLALHKMAFLVFWLCRGNIAFDAGFGPLRAFLNAPSQGTYRPYWEEMEDGSEPGIAVHFSLGFRGEMAGDAATGTLDRVAVALRVHHMRYRLVLMGEPPTEANDPASGWHAWRDPSEKTADNTPIVLGFDRLQRVT